MNFAIYGIYAGGSTVFLLVLIAGELLFSLSYARRERFALKFTLSNLIVLVASLLLTLLYYYIEYAFNSSLIASLRVIITYLIMFAMAVGAMKFSYKEPLLRCLSAGAAGYICQHISYNFYSIINESAGLEYYLIVRLGLAAYLLCMLIQLACAAAVLTVCYFAFAKRVNKLSAESTVRRNVLFIVICSLGIVIILSSIGYALSLDNVATSILLKCMQIVCCVFLMVIYLNIFEVKEAKNELAIVMKLNESEHAHFLKLKQDMELVSVKCHDIKHFIAAAGAKGGVDLAELSEAVKIYDTAIKTGNDVIDTLLAEQSLHCNAHGINLTVIADASPLSFIPVNDMCSLFGNLMENAVEAAEKVPEKDNRLININIRPVAGQVFFCVENSYAEEPVMRGGLPLSTKKSEAGYHGYGIKSVKMIAEKYGGNFTLGAKDGIFRVSILFPLPESEQK